MISYEEYIDIMHTFPKNEKYPYLHKLYFAINETDPITTRKIARDYLKNTDELNATEKKFFEFIIKEFKNGIEDLHPLFKNKKTSSYFTITTQKIHSLIGIENKN